MFSKPSFHRHEEGFPSAGVTRPLFVSLSGGCHVPGQGDGARGTGAGWPSVIQRGMFYVHLARLPVPPAGKLFSGQPPVIRGSAGLYCTAQYSGLSLSLALSHSLFCSLSLSRSLSLSLSLSVAPLTMRGAFRLRVHSAHRRPPVQTCVPGLASTEPPGRGWHCSPCFTMKCHLERIHAATAAAAATVPGPYLVPRVMWWRLLEGGSGPTSPPGLIGHIC